MIEPISPSAPPLKGRAVASQRWSRLTFLHWRAPSDLLAPLMPPGVSPDEHNGSSWVGLIAFYLDRATIAGSPAIPYFGSFTEVNVRLYGVDESGRRGVVFLSLEASRLAAVIAARAAFSIPYFWSSTDHTLSGDDLTYRARRHIGPGHTRIAAQRTDEIVEDATSRFLTARWGLFTSRRGQTIYLPNEHEPWQPRRAELRELDDSLLEVAGIPGLATTTPESVLYAESVTARFGRPL